ncbi:MAG: HupE/UreJ family protein [Phenylobacterium sp.]|uniref:HupE/UreJ family protein n=1 Tax=Phenylobacterium sp. TaxID=1871053 RepID=UPI0027270795|nr:HupE/UreJ family protein [Phenylobacterium sp.]MDO9431804.1 HupE/UreJ family protein [Phenylobacterium sp.]
MLAALLLVLATAGTAAAHGLGGKDAAFVAGTSGPDIIPFLYLGAKHMVTGYDHLLFLLGVIFFLYRFKDVALYVTLFSVGHSLTLLLGVLGGIEMNPYAIDAIIGLSVAYKAFDNLGGFRTVFGVQPNTRVAVFGFGLIHGFGLATKLQALELPQNGLLINMLAFNVGVEIGQMIALTLMLALILIWRSLPGYRRLSTAANVLLMTAGFVLIGFQLGGLVYGASA